MLHCAEMPNTSLMDCAVLCGIVRFVRRMQIVMGIEELLLRMSYVRFDDKEHNCLHLWLLSKPPMPLAIISVLVLRG